jgi:uncharacterized protein YndB with AHSA1/START domain
VAQLFIRKNIEVSAPVEVLWKVLTDSEFIRQYMFGCNAETDWKSGSPLLWRGAVDGVLYVKGNIVAIEPPYRLVYTVIDPNSTIADDPSNYLTMTYDLKRRNDRASLLEITQGDFAAVANGQKRYEDSNDGDNSMLLNIKKLAEEESRRT